MLMLMCACLISGSQHFGIEVVSFLFGVARDVLFTIMTLDLVCLCALIVSWETLYIYALLVRKVPAVILSVTLSLNIGCSIGTSVIRLTHRPWTGYFLCVSLEVWI